MTDKLDVTNTRNAAADSIDQFTEQCATQVETVADSVLTMGQSYATDLKVAAETMREHGRRTSAIVRGTTDNMRDLRDAISTANLAFQDNMDKLVTEFAQMPDQAHKDALAAVEKAISDAKAA